MSPIAISQLLSLWLNSHYDVIRASREYGARSPRSHYEVNRTMTSFATELATPSVTDERTDTLPRLIYKDDATHTYGRRSNFVRQCPVLHYLFIYVMVCFYRPRCIRQTRWYVGDSRIRALVPAFITSSLDCCNALYAKLPTVIAALYII